MNTTSYSTFRSRSRAVGGGWRYKSEQKKTAATFESCTSTTIKLDAMIETSVGRSESYVDWKRRSIRVEIVQAEDVELTMMTVIAGVDSSKGRPACVGIFEGRSGRTSGGDDEVLY